MPPPGDLAVPGGLKGRVAKLAAKSPAFQTAIKMAPMTLAIIAAVATIACIGAAPFTGGMSVLPLLCVALAVATIGVTAGVAGTFGMIAASAPKNKPPEDEEKPIPELGEKTRTPRPGEPPLPHSPVSPGRADDALDWLRGDGKAPVDAKPLPVVEEVTSSSEEDPMITRKTTSTTAPTGSPAPPTSSSSSESSEEY